MEPARSYRIGEIANHTGVSVETLRILREAATPEGPATIRGRVPTLLGRGGAPSSIHQAGAVAWPDAR